MDPLGVLSDVVNASLLPKWSEMPPISCPCHCSDASQSSTISRPSPFPVNRELNQKVVLWSGNVTKLNTVAIVNSTNESLSSQGSLSERIHLAAGPELLAECKQLHGCRTGEAKLSKGYNLPARYVVHTVGPRYNTKYRTAAESALFSCYRSFMRVLSLEYHCGGNDGWSSVYKFTATKDGVNWSPRIALYGDLGVVNAKSLSYVQQEVQRGDFDAILHVGDFAYDLYSDNARVGYDFVNQIQPIAAYLPYMTCPGNHEYAYNFSNYKNRFTMPGNTENMFYTSWNLGPMHIISISTEFYFFLEYGFEQIVKQYEWLEKDLQEAASPTNRTLRPWIMVMGHRPMYCSNSDRDDCTKHESRTRQGISSEHLFGLEDLFYKYGVDLLIWAHEHSYERLFPVYNRQMCNGSLDAPYTNPCAPVHIITGSGGCHEDHDPFRKDYGLWTAFRSEDYGYTRMNIYNNTHIYMDQVSVDKGGQVIDKMWLIKETHGPEVWLKTAK